MGRLVIRLALLAGAWWLFDRLWPAVRTEPATWMGDDWRDQVRARTGL
jgi:hypothetical protein